MYFEFNCFIWIQQELMVCQPLPVPFTKCLLFILPAQNPLRALSTPSQFIDQRSLKFTLCPYFLRFSGENASHFTFTQFSQLNCPASKFQTIMSVWSLETKYRNYMKYSGRWASVINARDPQSVVKNKEEHFKWFCGFLKCPKPSEYTSQFIYFVLRKI